jgi:hypothetical protein
MNNGAELPELKQFPFDALEADVVDPAPVLPLLVEDVLGRVTLGECREELARQIEKGAARDFSASARRKLKELMAILAVVDGERNSRTALELDLLGVWNEFDDTWSRVRKRAEAKKFVRVGDDEDDDDEFEPGASGPANPESNEGDGRRPRRRAAAAAARALIAGQAESDDEE